MPNGWIEPTTLESSVKHPNHKATTAPPSACGCNNNAGFVCWATGHVGQAAAAKYRRRVQKWQDGDTVEFIIFVFAVSITFKQHKIVYLKPGHFLT